MLRDRYDAPPDFDEKYLWKLRSEAFRLAEEMGKLGAMPRRVLIEYDDGKAYGVEISL